MADARKQKKDEIRGRAPTTKDGRNVDPLLGVLEGEAALVKVKRPEEAYPLHTAPKDEPRTYHGLPVLKQPVWKAWIPLYFFAGGAAGAAGTLGAAAALSGMKGLAARARLVSLAGIGVGSALLIADLGRPARFLHMLRVVRLTSPMSVGTWVLSASGAASALAVLGSRSAALALGVLGLPLSGYTAVLVSNTAIPAWLHARRTLPFLFVASAAASAASILETMPATPREERCIKTFGLMGKAAEAIAMVFVERSLRRQAHVAEALTRQPTWKAARILSIVGFAATALGRRRLAGTLGIAGALCIRFAIASAGKASARNPLAAVAS